MADTLKEQAGPEKTPQVLLTMPRGIEGKGGVERLMRSFLDAADAKDVNFIPFTTLGEGPALIRHPLSVLRFFHFILLSVTGKYDLVHLNVSPKGSTFRKVMYFYVARMFGRHTVFHIHGAGYDDWLINQPGHIRRFIVAAMSASDKVVVLGEHWRQFFVEKLGIPWNKVAIISNGVLDPYEGCQPAIQSEPPIQLAFLGEVGPRKGIPVLLQALAKIPVEVTDWYITIAGNGEVEKAQEQVRSLGLSGCVGFPGWVDREETRKILSQASVFVLPSQAENQPLAILEAMSAGCAVVSTTIGAIPEIVEEGKSGYLVEPGDADALADKLTDLITDSALRQEFGKNGRVRFEREFTIRTTIRSFSRLYRNTVNADQL